MSSSSFLEGMCNIKDAPWKKEWKMGIKKGKKLCTNVFFTINTFYEVMNYILIDVLAQNQPIMLPTQIFHMLLYGI